MYLTLFLRYLARVSLSGFIACSEREIDMERFNEMLSILDQTLNTKKKRHIAGGILLSVSFMFAGFALTAMTLRTEEED